VNKFGFTSEQFKMSQCPANRQNQDKRLKISFPDILPFSILPPNNPCSKANQQPFQFIQLN